MYPFRFVEAGLRRALWYLARAVAARKILFAVRYQYGFNHFSLKSDIRSQHESPRVALTSFTLINEALIFQRRSV